MTRPLPPGWYPDPNGSPEQLYWDGRAWHRNGTATAPYATAVATAMPRKRRRFFRRMLITFAVVFGLLWMIGQCDPGAETTADKSGSPSTVGAAPARPSIPTPAYEIVSNRPDDRFDGANSYYVVIAPIDPTTDGFKQPVEAVLRALAEKNGGPDFSARIFDDREAAEAEVGFKDDPSSTTQAQDQARYAANERHMIATYSGGIECAELKCENGDGPSAYSLTWFPSATTGSPDVGPWVEIVQWKP